MIMEEMTFFGRGLVVGFSIAAPVGPIGVLCIRRTLAGGRAAGFVSGLGAASADAIYGAIAGFGLTSISHFLVNEKGPLRLVGGLVLCFLGIRTFLSRPAEGGVIEGKQELASNFGTTFLLTLTNPMTILSFAAVFAGLGLGDQRGTYESATLLVSGVFLGSGAWWFLLSHGVALVQHRFDTRRLLWVNWLSGAILCTFGLLALLQVKK